MATAPPLQPTFWRTCRVLANRTRLRIFHLLLLQPGQTVSTVAARLKLPLPVASQYLRALEARSLLAARRVGRQVAYRPNADGTSSAQALVAALRVAFQHEATTIETLFKLATVFTQPRRIEIFHVLREQPRTLRELRIVTGISTRALVRHVNKLVARGYVAGWRGRYAVVNREDSFGRALARLAAG
jgi:DNA-binding transcriptional ArsR family regulator